MSGKKQGERLDLEGEWALGGRRTHGQEHRERKDHDPKHEGDGATGSRGEFPLVRCSAAQSEKRGKPEAE